MYNLNQFFRINKIVNVLLILVIALTFCFISIPIFHLKNAKKSLEESDFVQAGLYSSFAGDNTYYINILPLKVMADKTIAADYFMVGENTNYGGNFLTKYNGLDIENATLASGECAISKATAQKYKLNVGDSIVAHANFVDYPYQIKYIFDDYYGLGEIYANSYNYLVVLGFNQSILDGAYAKNIYHYSTEYTNFASDDIYEKSEVLKKMHKQYTSYCLIVIAVCCCVTLLVELVFARKLANDMLIYRRMGFRSSDVTRYIYIDSAYKYIIGFALALILTAAVVGIMKLLTSTLFLMMAICGVLCFDISITIQIIRCRAALKNI